MGKHLFGSGRRLTRAHARVRSQTLSESLTEIDARLNDQFDDDKLDDDDKD